MIYKALRRWPLLILGTLIIAWAVSITTAQDPTEARALLFGVGSVLLGSGLAVVILGYSKEENEKKDE